MKLELYVEPNRLQTATIESSEYKFKVGDKVRTTSGPYDPKRCAGYIGITGTIIDINKSEITSESGCIVSCSLNTDKTYWYLDCIELVEEA